MLSASNASRWFIPGFPRGEERGSAPAQKAARRATLKQHRPGGLTNGLGRPSGGEPFAIARQRFIHSALCAVNPAATGKSTSSSRNVFAAARLAVSGGARRTPPDYQ